MKTTLCLILTLFIFVTLAFVPNTFAQDSRPIVRLIYFVPSDRQPQPDMDTKFDQLIKEVQQGYEGIMEAHGFGKKTFLFESDADGNAVVHTVNGQEAEKHYNDENIVNMPSIRRELDEQSFGWKNINLVAIEVSSKALGGSPGICGIAQAYYAYEGGGGLALIPASGPCFSIWTAAHELGHAFGLSHDVRADAKKIEVDFDDFYTSFCAAEWLDVNRFFNGEQPISNEKPTIDMLPPSFVSFPNVIRSRFKVTHHIGIHQVQLTTAEIGNTTGYLLLGCRKLNGDTNATVEFVTSSLTPQSEYLRIKMIDVQGTIVWSELYPIDVSSLLPPSEAILIPDPNLAAVVRETLGLAPNSTITQLDMLELKSLNADKSDKHKTSGLITNLIGLERATQLRYLYLSNNRIQDITPITALKNLVFLGVASNQIKDITQFAQFTYLSGLYLGNNQISDVSPLSGLTRLKDLVLSRNKISDITPLTKMTNLRRLDLQFNQINDISPLAGLTKLGDLNLWNNQISDVSALAGLTNLTNLNIIHNQLNDISPLAGLTNLKLLSIPDNQISDVSSLVDLVNLEKLHLEGNPIVDREPLLSLLRKNPDVKIYLKRGGEPLPVTLSHFRAAHTDTGVVLKWITESEVDNAGFYIYRSLSKDGEFKVVNPTMIQGAGTTAARKEYTWTDTTAKPNTVYYYRIEDVSHAGVRDELATVRLKGLVSASGKRTTRWADLKR